MAHSAQEYLGSYRLLKLLRTGKTCQVWEAIHDAQGQRYALKVLLSEYLHNKEEIGYLRHEYQVAHKFDHPSVIHVYNFGADRHNVYLAMELCATPNVKQWIHQGVDQVAPLLHNFVLRAAEGLGYMHSQGWVHRDVKPDNFLMKSDGEVKLIDFALAQRVRRGLARLLPAKSSTIQGTRSYMSPEQIRNQPLDPRADIYSFGCMLYELVGGKPPFTGVSTNDLLMKHLRSGAPPLQSANSNVTDAFAQLVRKMIAKDPKARPPSLDDFLLEFRTIQIFKAPPRVART